MTACGYCFTCLEYCSKNMEYFARLNTRITTSRGSGKGPAVRKNRYAICELVGIVYCLNLMEH